MTAPLTAEQRQMVEDNDALVSWVCKRIGRWALDDDFLQAGRLGLIHAVQGFDPDAGFKFSTYATLCIRGFVLAAFNRGRGMNHQRAKARGERYSEESIFRPIGNLTDGAELIDSLAEPPGDEFHADALDLLRTLLAPLTLEDRQILGFTLEEAARRLGVPLKTVRKRRTALIAHLRREVARAAA